MISVKLNEDDDSESVTSFNSGLTGMTGYTAQTGMTGAVGRQGSFNMKNNSPIQVKNKRQEELVEISEDSNEGFMDC